MTPTPDGIASSLLRPTSLLTVLAASLALVAAGCSDSDNGSTAPPPVRPGPTLPTGADLPGLVVAITDVAGASGPGGSFQPGDTLSVRFTLELGNGDRLALDALDRGSIMVSGPTFNYQRVIAPAGDLVERSTTNSDGSHTYRFAEPLPEVYLPPLNDTPSFTLGELTGETLLDGTYTVGIEARMVYEIDGESVRDPGNATADFLVGGATRLQPREVVTTAHCNQCHDELSVHGDNRTEVANCLLCHTTGAEDRNVPGVAGGTPGVSIDFKVMIHKIHAGKHLPSVLGVTTNPDGTRKYDAPPQPYQVVGFGDRVHDYSEIGFPRWPSTAEPMPADSGYGSLSGTEQDLEDSMRSAPVDCASCHGDPDGSGPLPAPAQGDLIHSQPTTAACGSCHDDWVPEHPYTANTQTMPPQRDDSACTQCHRDTGSHLDVRDAHLHPLVDGDVAEGVVFDLTAVREAGSHNGDGNLDPGEKVEVDFALTDDAGNAIAPGDVSRWEVVVNGPTTNPNLLLAEGFPAAVLGSGPAHTTMLPERIGLERIGVSSSGTLQSFATGRTPHWNVAGAGTEIRLATATATASTLAAGAGTGQNFVDLAPGGTAGIQRNDLVAVGDLLTAEVHQVVFVEGDRLWFGSAGLERSHVAGSTLTLLASQAIPASQYALDPVTGVVTETQEFGAGAVLASYTTDFVVPATYPGPLNDSPDLDETWGDWQGLSVLDGTYTVGMFASRSFDVTRFGETTGYREASRPATMEFLVGDTTAAVPNERIASAANCYACHGDIQFHGGGRRGYQSCLLCHGVAGAEDRPQWVAPNAPETAGVTVDFRTMLHNIHHGRALANAASYSIVGFGVGYPDNYSVHTYEEVGFPAMPGGTMDCAVCHGTDNGAWMQPAERNHPEQGLLHRSWRAACNTCHDSAAARAHVDANTAPNGGEACSVCHGEDEEESVERVHRVR